MSLQAVGCHSHRVGYDMALRRSAVCWRSSQEPHQVTYDVVATPIRASSGHLRRCSDANTSNKCLSRAKDASILSWPTIGSLKAVDCHSHSVRYDMALESSPGGHVRCLIRSPMTL
eukprot:scaffold21540_cov237-Skeletonema_marinoi.AAC.2